MVVFYANLPKHFYPLLFHDLNLLYDEYILCLSVCLFVSNKSQNGWTDRAQIFVGPYVTPRKVYVWLNFQKFAHNKIRFLIILKIHEIFDKISDFLFLFYKVFKEKMLTKKYKMGVNRPNRYWWIFFKTMQLSFQGTGSWSSRIFHMVDLLFYKLFKKLKKYSGQPFGYKLRKVKGGKGSLLHESL